MPTLTKENAKYHCRTCLSQLIPSSGGSPAEAEDDEEQEFKDICISITSNDELKLLIAKYIDEETKIGYGQELPSNLCLNCYNKLQSFEKFCKKAQESAEKLLTVLFDRAKLEIGDLKEGNQEGSEIHNDDIYKMLQLRDTLMETESVLLDNSTAATLPCMEMHDPDPFDTPTPASAKSAFNTSSESSDEDDNEDNCNWRQDEKGESSENMESEDSKNKRKTRSTRKSNRADKVNIGTDNPSAKTVENVIKLENESEETEQDEDDDDDDDEESNTETEAEARNPLIQRLRNKNNYKSTKTKKPAKKKRRTKKEMEEWRRSQADKNENKIKRRNKGTKNSFKCTQCNHCFAHKITLDAHIRKVHEGSKRPFQCDRCDKSYTFIGGLYTHIKEIHETEVRSYACDFPGCDRIYTSFIAMQKHKRLKHSDISYQKKYVCEQCGATFNQSGNLKYHRRTKHPTDAEQAEKEKSKERFECLVCKKFFHSRYTLKYHTLQLHTNDMKYECEICGRRMAKKFMLVQHMLVHSTDKMPCEHCGKQFIRKFELEAHIRAVHMKLKPFECQYCSECFASRKTLRHHEYIHTGEKPYVCDLCGQAYRQQTCLKNHRKSHGKHLLEANLNRTLMHTFLAPQQQQTNVLPSAPIISLADANISASAHLN